MAFIRETIRDIHNLFDYQTDTKGTYWFKLPHNSVACRKPVCRVFGLFFLRSHTVFEGLGALPDHRLAKPHEAILTSEELREAIKSLMRFNM